MLKICYFSYTLNSFKSKFFSYVYSFLIYSPLNSVCNSDQFFFIFPPHLKFSVGKCLKKIINTLILMDCENTKRFLIVWIKIFVQFSKRHKKSTRDVKFLSAIPYLLHFQFFYSSYYSMENFAYRAKFWLSALKDLYLVTYLFFGREEKLI